VKADDYASKKLLMLVEGQYGIGVKKALKNMDILNQDITNS
jgi:hypothetical protein